MKTYTDPLCDPVQHADWLLRKMDAESALARLDAIVARSRCPSWWLACRLAVLRAIGL